MRQTPCFVAFRVVFRRVALATATGLAVVAAGGGWASAGRSRRRSPHAARPLVTASRLPPRRPISTPCGRAPKLPTGTQCAKWVPRPAAENKGMNRRYNHTDGHYVGKQFFAGDRPKANRRLAPRINGHFTGTTKQILRWAACKWGINQNHRVRPGGGRKLVAADHQGRFGHRRQRLPARSRARCRRPPGPVPAELGILQNRYPYEKSCVAGHAVYRDERRHRLRDLAVLLRRLRDLAEHRP